MRMPHPYPAGVRRSDNLSAHLRDDPVRGGVRVPAYVVRVKRLACLEAEDDLTGAPSESQERRSPM